MSQVVSSGFSDLSAKKIIKNEKRVNMHDELVNRKYQYERFIRNLNDNYSRLESCYSNLLLCKKKINDNLKIEDNLFDYRSLNDIIKNIESKKDSIKNVILPQARYEYNNILIEISKM